MYSIQYLLIKGKIRVDVGPVCPAKSINLVIRNIFTSQDYAIDNILLAIVSPQSTFSYSLAIVSLYNTE